METKRILSLLLVFVMSLGVLAGCGGKKTNVEELPEGTVTLTVGIPQKATVTDYDDNAFTNYLEEQANVEIEFVYFSSSSSEYKQQLTLMCGANETLPDVILGFEFSHYIVNQYGEDGYFIDLTDYIEEYAPNYKKMIKELDEETQDYISEKGKNTNTGAYYGMPRVTCQAIDQLQSMMYINQNWLTKLGLPMPKTVEELKSTLQAFKTKDPNGNGMNDEIPMLGKTGIVNYLINGYVLYDQNNFNVTDGKVWDPVQTEEFRQALIFANQLVKAELYDKMSFSISSSSEYKTLISPTDGPSKVGVFVGHHENMTNPATNALDEFVALPALSDATGKGGYTMVTPAGVTWAGYITKDCAYPAAAMKFLDTFYTDETMTRQRHGEKDVDWVYEEKENAYGTKSYAKAINSEAYFSGNSTWCLNALGIMTHWNYLLIATEGEGRIAQASRLQSEQWDIYQNGKRPEEEAVNLIYTTDEYEIREDKASTVNSYITTETNYFVSGEKDPSNDGQWNEFLSTLKSIGRDELMKVCQDAYTRQEK